MSIFFAQTFSGVLFVFNGFSLDFKLKILFHISVFDREEFEVILCGPILVMKEKTGADVNTDDFEHLHVPPPLQKRHEHSPSAQH